MKFLFGFMICLIALSPWAIQANADRLSEPNCPALKTVLGRFRYPKASRVLMEELTLTGLNRTSEEFVRDEIGFEAGCSVATEDVQAAVQRLRNTNFFQSVELFQENISEKAIRVHLVFEEKWTLTPVVRGGSGGGVTFFVFGLYDLNAMGAGIESGVQYEQYAGAPGVSVWWRDPHVGSRDWKVSLEFSEISRPVFFLHPENNLYYTPLAREKRFSVMGYRRFGTMNFGFGVEPLSRALLSTEFPSPGFLEDFASPALSGLNFKSVLRFNGLNLNDVRYQGVRSELGGELLLPLTPEGQQIPRVRLSAQNLAFLSLSERHNLGWRVQSSWVSGTRLLDMQRLGSIEGVRGLVDGERIGQIAWMTNLEYRYSSYMDRLHAVQNVLFVDAGNSGFKNGSWPYPLALSVGTGLRLGFRPVARLRLRADYALGIRGLRNKRSWIVGMQQYF